MVNDVKLTADQMFGQYPLTVTFTATPNTSHDIPPYTWEFGDGTPPVQGGKIMTHEYKNPGNYNIYVTVPAKEGPAITGTTGISAWGIMDTFTKVQNAKAVCCGRYDLVYVADEMNGVYFLDGTDPYNIEQLLHITNPGNATNLTNNSYRLLVVYGQIFKHYSVDEYNQTYNNYREFSIQNGTFSAVYAKDSNYYYAVGEDNEDHGFLKIFSQGKEKASLGLLGPGRDVLGNGDLLFVAADNGGLEVYDLSNPEPSCRLSHYPTGIGGEVYYGLFLKDKRLYVAGKSRIIIYDIDHENKKKPLNYKGDIDIPGSAAYKVCVSQNHAFVAAGSEGILVIDVANPANARIIGSLSIPGAAYSIWVDDMKAYVTTESGEFHSVCVVPPWPIYY